MRCYSKKAFTLVQLLIVLGILAVITAIGIPVIGGMLSNAETAERAVWIEELQSAVDLYKTTKVENIHNYPRLGTEEQKLFTAGAGVGEIPGYTVDVQGKTAEEVYNAIRKEYFTSLKAFSDMDVSADYYLADKYASEESAYVYYYLSGEVAEVAVEDLQFDSGSATLEALEYWVYLSEPAKKPVGHELETGSGFGSLALGEVPIDSVDNTVLPFYVKVVDFATGEPLEDITVRLVGGSDDREAVTGNTGTVFFSKVPTNTYVVKASADGWLDYPDDDIYLEDSEKGGITTISRRVVDGVLTRYVGDYLQNPYIIRLKRGTLGSLRLTELVSTYDGTKWVDGVQAVTANKDFTVDFKVTPENVGTSARAQEYPYNPSSGDLALLDGSRFLTFGNYEMTISVSDMSYRTVTKPIVSKLWGIDDVPVNRYADEVMPYVYEQYMLKATSTMRGSLTMAESVQPIAGTLADPSLGDTWFGSSSNKAPTITTTITLSQNGDVKYTATVGVDGSYTIPGIVDGAYDIHISNEYNSDIKPTGFPAKITVAGGEYVADGVISKEQLTTTSVTFDVRFSDNDDPIGGATVYLQRYGETDKVGGVLSSTSNTVKFSNIKTGFYSVSCEIPFNSTINRMNIFVDEDGLVQVIYPQWSYSKITMQINNPYGAVDGFGASNITIIFVNQDMAKRNTSIKCNASGLTVATVRPGNYKIQLTSDKHYEATTTFSAVLPFYSKAMTGLTSYTNTYNRVINFAGLATSTGGVSESRHAGAVIWRQAGNSSNTAHERYCTVCGCVWESAACIFDNTIAANVKSITGTDGVTKHRVECSICHVNTEDQSHVFTGAYVNIVAHTTADNGTHSRKCLYCTDVGLDGERNKVQVCSNTTDITSNTHTYTCNECKSTKTYTHTYAGEYKPVTAKSSASTGTHYQLCTGCASYGTGSGSNAVKDKTVNCTNVETITDTTHTQACKYCSNTTGVQSHNFNGAYKNVTAHTLIDNGTHNRKCYNCSGYGVTSTLNATQVCSNTTTTVTSTHTYTCNECKSAKTYNHAYTEDLKNVTAHTTVTNGTHDWKCTGCDTRGVGSGTSSVKGATEKCVNKTTYAVGGTQHVYTCTVCASATSYNHTHTGAATNVSKHTTATNGTHYYKCAGCDSKGFEGVDNKKESCGGYNEWRYPNAATHRVYCTVCASYTDGTHAFTGAYKNVVAHTTASNGTHNRKCTICPAYGVGTTKDSTAACSNTTTTTSTQHTYTCNECKSAKSINHSFTNSVGNVSGLSTSGTGGTHDWACTGCNQRGATGTVGATSNCSVSAISQGSTGHYWQCSVCKATSGTGSHSMSAGPSVGGTCVSYGTITHRCSSCSYSYTTQGSKNSSNHTGGTYNETTFVGYCTVVSRYAVHCSSCKATISTNNVGAFNPTNHTGGVYDNPPSASCKVVQTYNKTCKSCNVVVGTGTVAKSKEHTGTRIASSRVAATCTAVGSVTYECSLCGGAWGSDELPMIAHNYSTPVKEAPTCLLPGVWRSNCTMCNKDNSTSIPPLRHDTKTVTTAGTCKVSGTKVTTCKRSGCSYRTSENTGFGDHKYLQCKCVMCGRLVSKYQCSVCADIYGQYDCTCGGSLPGGTSVCYALDKNGNTCYGIITNGVCNLRASHKV